MTTPSKAQGILIKFPDGTKHIVRATPQEQHSAFASLTRWFDSMAHDGEHDHDTFAQAMIKRGHSFNPATERGQVWPDVVSYLAQYEVDADPERDAEDEDWEALSWELVPATEPFNVVDARLRPDGQWEAGCDPVISFAITRDLRDGKLQVFNGMDAFTGSDFTSAHTAHRPSPACSDEWSTEPTCSYAAGHLKWVIESKAQQQLAVAKEDA